MTLPIAQRLRDAAVAFREEGVSMRAMAQAHGPEAHGTLLLLLAMPCLLPVPGVGTVLGVGMAALAVAMWRGQGEPCLPQGVANLELPRHWARRVLEGLASAYEMAGRHARARGACRGGRIDGHHRGAADPLRQPAASAGADAHRARTCVSRRHCSDLGAADVRCGIDNHDRPVAYDLDLGQRVDPGMGLTLNGTDR